ncbi:MAG: hypothetical protein VXW45_07100 [Pseudomonadota bacterium]|nr:hypothetical protein [Pseudomonadota bacterium]
MALHHSALAFFALFFCTLLFFPLLGLYSALLSVALALLSLKPHCPVVCRNFTAAFCPLLTDFYSLSSIAYSLSSTLYALNAARCPASL